MNTKFYTVDELAETWGINRNTVINLILTQQLSATVIGKQYRISEEQLQEYYSAYTIHRKNKSAG